MPNFNTHWLIAIQVIDSLHDLKNGYDRYVSATNQYAKNLRHKVRAIKTDWDLKMLQKDEFKKIVNDYEKELHDPAVYDSITCFSAYMLGACGPDFWTVPTGFSMAGVHFDLGHYNRTHRQFEIAIERAKKRDKDDFQSKIERAYFLGMATHIAADLIIHQLVNVYAGAYNLLEKKWENEHGSVPFDLWKIHNKVEHYWDSYVRFRYLGDYGPVFDQRDKKDWLASLGFPVVDSLIREVKNSKTFEAQDALIKWLAEDDTKIKIERPLNFPRIAADRIRLDQDPCRPFIYDVVVDKNKGAYPSDDMFTEATDEANSRQMNSNGKTSEAKKLNFFSTKKNNTTNPDSNNYLTYYVCPNLARLGEYGLNVFYHLDALEPFLQSAVKLGRKFTSLLGTAFDTGRPDNLRELGHFWNLDTGQGLQVQNILSDTSHEVVTKLKFTHVTDCIRDAAINYSTYEPNLKCMFDKKMARKNKKFDTLKYPKPPVQAFPVYSAKERFESLTAMATEKDKYLDRISLENKQSLISELDIESFFVPACQSKVKSIPIETSSYSEVNTIVTADIKHRLTLQVETAIAPFRTKDSLAHYLLGDQSLDPVKGKDKQQKWLKDGNTKPLNFIAADTNGNNGVSRFIGHYLINFEKDKTLKEKSEQGKWNNVVEYEKNKKYYTRNHAVSTGRQNVLCPDGDGDFWGDKDFKYFEDVSPTEHIFFTLYLLAKTDEGVHDLVTKEEVTEARLKDLKKIESLGFVKLVLLYEWNKHGVAQIAECYVDGLKIPVERVH